MTATQVPQPTAGELFQQILQGVESEALSREFPFYPLTSPGMPLPGPDFVAAATSLGDPPPVTGGRSRATWLESHGSMLHYLYRRALYDERFHLPVVCRNRTYTAETVPGHLLGVDTRDCGGGPRAADVLLLGKNPGRDELQERANFVGPTSQVLFDALEELGVTPAEWNRWYGTNLIRWPQLDQNSDAIPDSHRKDCALLLEQELRLVRPRFVLCLGTDAAKYLLTNYGRDTSRAGMFGVGAMVGRVEKISVPLHLAGQPPQFHEIQVMALTHPASVYRNPEQFPAFRDQLALFLSLVSGAEVGGRERGLRHVNVYTARHLKRIVDEIRADPNPSRRLIAVDGEWNGEHPGNPGAYLRTIQFSSAHGEGICVVLRHQGGAPAFQPSIGHAIAELRRLLKYDPEADYYPRIGGHFFRADLPWLMAEGLDLRAEYAPADTPEGCREFGGWDSGLMHHAVHETASFRLTDMLVRLTTIPVYDARLKRHIEGYCAATGIKKDDLEGYGFLPSWILHPEPTDPEHVDGSYAQYDPDATRRIAVRHAEPGGMLDRDWFGNSSWEPYWRSHRASLGVLEMEQEGLCLDRKRVDELTVLFMASQDALLQDFRRQINWPAFNPSSQPQCVELLFGEEYNQKRLEDGSFRRLRPADVASFRLQPIKTTGKRPRLWSDIVSRGEANAHTPSTDKEVLGILGHAHPLVMQLRDLKFISQVLKGPLRPPTTTDDGDWVEDEGHLTYSKGLASMAAADGRVHTHVSQVKETGRSSSARPPVQNLSSRREGDYARILGTFITNSEGVQEYKGDYWRIFPQPLYSHPVRSIFCAPEDHVLVEADYTGAELAMIAWLANDPTMIEDVRRNSLPEHHPDFYDIHSETAVRAFRLTCAATKKGLKKAGLLPLRVAAKNVNFGVPYGRQAEAIARQCREEGVDVSEAECQLLIDYYFQRYPNTGGFLEECERRSQTERWLAGPYGRFRRFIQSRDRGVQGEQRRAARNFPIQNGVADAVWQAIYNFYAYRAENPAAKYRLLLTIHDALLFAVPRTNLREFIQDEWAEDGSLVKPSILRTCMTLRVPIWPRYLDNTPMPVASPYFFSNDISVEENWGEPMTEERAIQLGLDPALVA